jgi:copper ion binding protein
VVYFIKRYLDNLNVRERRLSVERMGNMKKIILKIGGMSCQHCVKAVENALRQLPGVQSVQVELENQRAVIDGDESQFVLQDAEKAITDQGYDFLGVENK